MRLVIIACLAVSAPGLVWAQGDSQGEANDSARAIAKARGYILSRLDAKTGRCEDEHDRANPRFGGKTALCVYALVSAGEDYRKTPVLKKAIRWLLRAKLNGTYAVALRATALASLKDDRARHQLQRDVKWLLQAGYRDGAYTYTSAKGKTPSPEDRYDNSNSQWAALGVWSAAQRGLHVPMAFWKRTERHWLTQQQPDGGWGYRTQQRDGKTFARPYGSMTAAGVATLSICYDQIARPQIIDCAAAPESPEYKALTRGLGWMERNFSVEVNPKKNLEWYYFWLFSLQRVGTITGRKYLAGADWYTAGSDRLAARQNADGSWGYGDRTAQTCFALLFLARGRAPILLSKVRYPGTWNGRPRDAANLTRWLGYMYERRLGWQVLDLTPPPDKPRRGDADWEDGRIVYLSGAGPIELTESQVNRLRRFVDRGGMIFSEAACNNGDFTLDMHKLAQRLFPRYRLEPLPEKHPIYRLQFFEVAPPGLLAVTNGIRPLLIHSPRDVSLALELGPNQDRRATFNQMANLYLYLTQKGATSPRGQAVWPALPKRKATKTIRLARVRHAGNCDPEPAAMNRLAAQLARLGVTLKVSPLLTWDRIEAEQFPIAHMTGTEDFKLTDATRQALRAYLAAGGTLIADAAGNRQAFADAFRREILTPLGPARLIPLQSKLYTAGPTKLDPFRYRRATAARMSKDQKVAPRLEAVYLKGRPVVIFSPDDITANLVGYPLLGMKGLRPTTARQLMTNLVMQLGK